MKPISTRLRNKNKKYSSASPVRELSQDSTKREDLSSEISTTTYSLEDNVSFSPRSDPDIYLDELRSPLSFIRGSEEDKNNFLKEESDRMVQNFGKRFKSNAKLSTFYSAQVAAPVPSKRTRHRTTDTTTTATATKTISAKRVKFIHTNNQQSDDANKNTSRTKKSNNSTLASQSDDNDEALVPLPLSKKLPKEAQMSAKEKEREYWRRQRRAFVYSRFLSNDEGAKVAGTVYSNIYISSTNRMVISFQGNLSNFRTKLRRTITKFKWTFNITKERLLNEEQRLSEQVLEQLNQDTINTIWGHWIAEPYVDIKSFYANKESIKLLKEITVKLAIIFFKEKFHILTLNESRVEMKKIDLLSRTLILPDPKELAT
ncbi:uncharacterized protein BX663DRAFT_524333 [Cokeromyces recurvatus]|uniref:uncharacterized protein n=1 Tax=Cokeromyces recurvatus TaxID=90255 RepID=UPI0022208930|nr:uncharacterized protein BX663DRAFT_524333 [Cokeromyces recurvatus]KAI7898667.1 hypothetical protein BX663DRAFT_524333 [Cokeromyces recurvatus]